MTSIRWTCFSPEETLKKIYPANPIASACIYILSNITEPGHIKKYGGVFLLLAGITPLHAALHAFALACQAADLNIKITKETKLDCWRKYLFISAFGTLTATYDQSMGEIVSERYEALNQVLHEIVAVANLPMYR